MNATPMRIHIDDRGASRQLVDMWLPHLDVDVVWLVGAPPPDDAPVSTSGVPFVELAASDVPAVAAEDRETALRVLVIFTTPAALDDAARLGLPPSRVTINRLRSDEAPYRIAHEVSLDDDTLDVLRSLEERGFTFEVQTLPNVTARPWLPSSFTAAGDVEPDATPS